MNTSNALLVTQLLLQAATQVQQFGSLLAKAQAEGRDVTDAEIDQYVGRDDASRVRLQALIDSRN